MTNNMILSADTAVVESELPALAEKINDAIESAEEHARSACQTALRAGELLNQAKAHVQHGGWDDWLTANCRVKPRTARAYMQLASKLQALPHEERQRVADLPVREAIRAISTKPESAPRCNDYRAQSRDEAQRAAGDLRRSGAALHKAAKSVRLGSLKGNELAKLKVRLQKTLEMIAAMEAAR